MMISVLLIALVVGGVFLARRHMAMLGGFVAAGIGLLMWVIAAQTLASQQGAALLEKAFTGGAVYDPGMLQNMQTAGVLLTLLGLFLAFYKPLRRLYDERAGSDNRQAGTLGLGANVLGGMASGSVAEADTYPCPYCAEPIKTAAIKCKHCGSNVEPRQSQGQG